MITAIISIGQAQGGEVWLAGWLLCAALYFVLFLLFQKANQTSANTKNIVFWFLAAECCNDLIWAVVSYGGPAYIHYGIAAVYGLLLWPVLLAAGVIASAQNRKQNHLV